MAKHLINPEYKEWSSKRDASVRQNLTNEQVNTLRRNQRVARFSAF